MLPRNGRWKHDDAHNSGSRKGKGGRLFDLSHGRGHSKADFSGSGSDLGDSCLSGGQSEKGRRLLDLSGRRERNQADFSESDTELVDPRSPSRLSGNRILQERGSSRGLPRNGRRKQDAHNSGLRKGKGGRLFDLSYGRENNRADFSGPISDLGGSRRSGGQSEKDRRLLDLSSRRECNQVDFSESDTELVDPRSPSSLSEIRILKKRGRSQVLSKNGHGHQKKGVRFSESESEGRYPCRHPKSRVKEEAGQGESTKSVQKRHARDEIQIQELKGLLGEVKKAISKEEQVRKNLQDQTSKETEMKEDIKPKTDLAGMLVQTSKETELKEDIKPKTDFAGMLSKIPRFLTFDGTGNYRTFEMKFNDFIGNVGLDTKQAILLLGQVLQGRAADFFQREKERQKFKDVSDALKYVRDRYEDRELPAQSLLRLNSAVQLEGEDVRTWSERVRELAYKALPTSEAREVERQVVIRFCLGLKNKEAARHIKCQSPDNMHDALSHFDIFTYAEGDPENRKGKAVRKVESEDVQGTSSSTLTNHIEKPGLDSGDRASNKSILKSLIKLTELIQNNLDSLRKGTGEQDQSKSKTRGGACYNCGLQGHLARNCLAKKKIRRVLDTDTKMDSTQESDSGEESPKA